MGMRRWAMLTAAAAALTPGAARAAPAPIAGGEPAPTGRYPFVAGIKAPLETTFFCTGSLVAPTWVVTAAHCVDAPRAGTQMDVHLDMTELAGVAASERRRVKTAIPHPRWRGSAGGSWDVALLELEAPSAVTPVRVGMPRALRRGISRCRAGERRLPGLPPVPDPYCIATSGRFAGWGRVAPETLSDRLNEAPATIRARRNGQFWSAKAGGCAGDSGGPLMVRDAGTSGTRYLIGVAAFISNGPLNGGSCSRTGSDYFTDVTPGPLPVPFTSTGRLYRWLAGKGAVPRVPVP